MAAQDPAVFIGSSAEGKRYAEYLQAALEDYCEAAVWDQGAFGLSESGLGALVAESQRVDYAILILTPDDLTIKRDKRYASARDNVIFEAGLFVGALGPSRTFLVHAKDLKLDLPSDLAGITTCSFRSERSDANLRAAVNPAALRIREVMEKLGVRDGLGPLSEAPDSAPAASAGQRSTEEERAELIRELDALALAAEAQGWSVKTRTDSVFRVLSKNGIRYSFSIGSPRETRIALRDYARELNEQGLRMNRTLLLPVGAVPPPSSVHAIEGTSTQRSAQRPKRPAKAASKRRPLGREPQRRESK